jgi:hypothetical protein
MVEYRVLEEDDEIQSVAIMDYETEPRQRRISNSQPLDLFKMLCWSSLLVLIALAIWGVCEAVEWIGRALWPALQ